MNFSLKPTPLVCHFVPGFTTLIYLFFMINNWHIMTAFQMIKVNDSSIIFIGFAFLVISFSTGLLFDAVRDIAEKYIDKFSSQTKNIYWDFFFKSNNDDIKKLEKWYFTWYVFGANMAIGIFFVLMVSGIYHYHFSSLKNQTFIYGEIFGIIALIVLLIDTKNLRDEIANLTNSSKYRINKPDFNVYTRIKCSDIAGVGVFAIKDIPKGTLIFAENCDCINYKKADLDLQNKSKEIVDIYKDFCPYNKEKETYTCPENFNFMTISWYLNRPKNNESPNVICNKELDFFAGCDIKNGEELTIDYGTYGDEDN